MKRQTIRTLCLTGVFAALIFLFTAYLHIPTHTGYTHIGDGLIYLAACLLPWPYAVFASAAGAVLADVATGFAIWAPATVVIKTVTVFFFCRTGKKILSLRNACGLIPSALLCTGGYYLYEVLITKNWVAPLAGIPGYLVQSALSSALFIAAAIALDRMKIKRFFAPATPAPAKDTAKETKS